MTSAADPLFVDTNILVYASWAAAPLHTHARSVLATRAIVALFHPPQPPVAKVSAA